MSENYEYCYLCGKAIRIGLDDEPNEYAWCGCEDSSEQESVNGK